MILTAETSPAAAGCGVATLPSVTSCVSGMQRPFRSPQWRLQDLRLRDPPEVEGLEGELMCQIGQIG